MIREFQREDFGAIRRYADDFWSEIQFAEFLGPINIDYFQRVFWSLYQEGKIKMWVFEKPGNGVVGGLCMLENINLFTGKRGLEELFWFVSAPYRNSSCSIRLIKEMEKFALTNSYDYITIYHMDKPMPEKLKKFYESQKYTPAQWQYIKKIK